LKIYRRVVGAINFLTISPSLGKSELEGASAFFPLAGWLVGGILFLLWTPMDHLPLFVRAFIIIVIWESLSRGLHLDALADTADAFIAGGSRERILAILGDTRVGAFGVTAISLLLIGKFALLSSIPWERARDALLLACVLGRYTPTLLASLFPPAKEDGLGSLIISSSGIRELVIATIIGVVPSAFLFRMSLAYASAGLAVSLLFSLYVWKKIGGLTGDTLGACVEITELAALFAFLPKL
jgi:adenosylcobinamide-GDP ribazoletransferase